MNFLSPLSPLILSALRIMSGLLILQFGTSKILAFPQSKYTGVELTSLSGIAGVLELVGGALLVIGLFTRPAAFILSGLMAAAYFIAHAPNSFYPMLNGGTPAALFCFVFLYICAAGPGPLSLDRIFGSKA